MVTKSDLTVTLSGYVFLGISFVIHIWIKDRTIALWYPKWIGSSKHKKVSNFESCANNCENGGVSVEITMLMLRCSLCSCSSSPIWLYKGWYPSILGNEQQPAVAF